MREPSQQLVRLVMRNKRWRSIVERGEEFESSMKLQGRKGKNDWRGTWLGVRMDRVSLV